MAKKNQISSSCFGASQTSLSWKIPKVDNMLLISSIKRADHFISEYIKSSSTESIQLEGNSLKNIILKIQVLENMVLGVVQLKSNWFRDKTE